MSGKKQISLLFKTIILTILVSITQSIDLNRYGSEQITIGKPSKQPFSSTTQICCNGIIQEKPSFDTKCCGFQTYSNSSHICCGQSIISIKGNLRCCSNQLYDPKVEDCTLFVTDANLNNEGTQFAVTTGKYVALPIAAEYNFPCGNAIINLNTTMCCRNTPVPLAELKNPQCCGLKPYDPKKHSCCDETEHWRTAIVPKVDYPVSCCEKKPYNALKQYCDPSNNEISDLPDQNHTLCGTELINQNNQICCERDIIIAKLKSHHTECCGTVSYSPSEQSCCNDEFISPDETKKCCKGHGLYDPTVGTCCIPEHSLPGYKESTVQLSPNKVGQCCYTDVYNEAKEYCCGISVLPKLPDDQSRCCEYTMNGTVAESEEFLYAYKMPTNDEELYKSLLSKLEEIRKKKKGNKSDTFKLSLIVFLLSLFFSISI